MRYYYRRNGHEFYYSVKDLSQEDILAIAYYFYRISIDIVNCKDHSVLQRLYNSLVLSLNLENHSRKVIAAVIGQHVKSKRLTLTNNEKAVENSFDFKGELSKNYKEDDEICNRCSRWFTGDEVNIDLVRAVFATKEPDLAKIIAYSFFYAPSENRKTFKIPQEIEIPHEFNSYINDISKVQFLIDTLKLTEEEGRLLSVAYSAYSIEELYYVADSCCGNKQMAFFYSRMLDVPEKAVRFLFRGDGKFKLFGLFDDDGYLDGDIAESVFFQDINIYFGDTLKKDEKDETFALDSFSVKEDESELVIRLLKNAGSANILLYGAPGTGKTEYARALAKNTGFDTYIFRNELEASDESGNHALNRLNCLLSLRMEDSVIIVDEAESVIATNMFFGLKKKGVVNTMLESSVNKVIWILNYPSALDSSTLRRFTYSIHFREMSRILLRNIVDSKLNALSMSESLHSELVNLCGKYHVTAASVDNVVKTVKGMDLSLEKEGRVVSDVKKVLEANSTLLFGKKKMRETVKGSYDISVLNTSVSAEKIVGMVLNAQGFAESGDDNGNEYGIRMLFYGLSGTGKTEFARYIAEKLNKRICLKRGSDILGSYVGESERNIAEAFAQADEIGDILLFDEADSFFSNRQYADHSWERTLVNEFLTQMEEFSGILICTTNLREIMDPAMQRRFHVLAEFKPLTQDGIERLLARFFKGYDFCPAMAEKLMGYNSVTPGDFGAVAGKIRFLPKGEISSDMIIEDLCEIQREKLVGGGKTIGFAG